MTMDISKVWTIAKDMRVCMMTSWNGKQQQSRPMTSNVREDKNAIYFLDKLDSTKEKEIAEYSAISLSYANKGSNVYLAIAGHAKVTNDRTIIKEIWSDFDKMFFDYAEDPTIRLITVTPESAEVWEGPNKLVAGIKMLAAAITDLKPTMGKQKKIAM